MWVNLRNLAVPLAGPKRPHEPTEANRIKGTSRGLYHKRDAEPSQRAPLQRDQAVTSFYSVKRFYYVRLFRLVWAPGSQQSARSASLGARKNVRTPKRCIVDPTSILRVRWRTEKHSKTQTLYCEPHIDFGPNRNYHGASVFSCESLTCHAIQDARE